MRIISKNIDHFFESPLPRYLFSDHYYFKVFSSLNANQNFVLEKFNNFDAIGDKDLLFVEIVELKVSIRLEYNNSWLVLFENRS